MIINGNVNKEGNFCDQPNTRTFVKKVTVPYCTYIRKATTMSNIIAKTIYLAEFLNVLGLFTKSGTSVTPNPLQIFFLRIRVTY